MRSRTPRPSPDPIAAVPSPGPAAALPTTDVPVAADAAAVKAAWREAHPSARRWAEQRGGTPRAPDPARIALGLVLIGLAAWFLTSFAPAHRPLAAADDETWRYGATAFRSVRALAILLATVGVLAAVRGATFRRRLELRCQSCGLDVVAERRGLALRCPEGGHRAGIALGAVGLGLAALALLIALLVLSALASLGGLG